MSHEFERHIEFAMKGNNQQGVTVLKALKTNFEALALAGIVPVLPKEQISRPDQLPNEASKNFLNISIQGDEQKINKVFETISEAILLGYSAVGGADTTAKLVNLMPGLTKENIYYWERSGYINPAKVKRGSRNGREFDVIEALRVAYIWKHLRDDKVILRSAVLMTEQDIDKEKVELEKMKFLESPKETTIFSQEIKNKAEIKKR